MNIATKTIVSVIGIVIGVAGINHGFFETLQGHMPTNGILIAAIGEEQRMWLYGGEEAMTLIPNYLLTGLAAIAVSLVLMWCSHQRIDNQHGPTVFILLCVLLLLVGGALALCCWHCRPGRLPHASTNR